LIASGWFNVLSRVHSATAQQLREMQDEQANPKNAVVSYCATSPWAHPELSAFNYFMCVFPARGSAVVHEQYKKTAQSW